MEKGYLVNEQIQKLLQDYYKTDKDRIKQAFMFLENKGENWDKTVISADGVTLENLTLLLVYEYSLATEKITRGKITFNEALEKLNKIDKFRLGEPKVGDEEIVYGKSLDDSDAMSIVSDRYDEVRRLTGAQHTDYVDKDGKLRTAVLICGKKVLKDGSITTGTDFNDLSDIRQTAFHEWDHNGEKEEFPITNQRESCQLPKEYRSIDGKVYSNYDLATQYRLPVFESGIFVGMSEIHQLEPREQVTISRGLATKENNSDGIIMHNQITEGFVELYARKQVLAIDPNATIDEGKYYEQVEMAKRIDAARDGTNNLGQTAADFLSHSSIFKKELEAITVDGMKDGLHYIADYADAAHARQTNKHKKLRSFDIIASKLKLTDEQIEQIQKSPFWTRTYFTQEDIKEIFAMFSRYIQDGNENNQIYEEIAVAIDSYVLAAVEERKFFDGIPEKLGYKGIPTQPLGDGEKER